MRSHFERYHICVAFKMTFRLVGSFLTLHQIIRYNYESQITWMHRNAERRALCLLNNVKLKIYLPKSVFMQMFTSIFILRSFLSNILTQVIGPQPIRGYRTDLLFLNTFTTDWFATQINRQIRLINEISNEWRHVLLLLLYFIPFHTLAKFTRWSFTCSQTWFWFETIFTFAILWMLKHLIEIFIWSSRALSLAE